MQVHDRLASLKHYLVVLPAAAPVEHINKVRWRALTSILIVLVRLIGQAWR